MNFFSCCYCSKIAILLIIVITFLSCDTQHQNTDPSYEELQEDLFLDTLIRIEEEVCVRSIQDCLVEFEKLYPLIQKEGSDKDKAFYHYRVAKANFIIRKEEKVKEELERCLHICEGNTHLDSLRVYAYRLSGDNIEDDHPDKALEYYQLALDLSSDKKIDRTLHARVAGFYAAMGEYEIAIEKYENLLAIAEQEKDTFDMSFMTVNIGISLLKFGNTSEAIEAFKQVIDLIPNTGKQGENELQMFSRHFLGKSYMKDGQYEKAIDYLPIHKPNPSEKAQIYFPLMNCFLQLNQLDSAAKYLKMGNEYLHLASNKGKISHLLFTSYYYEKVNQPAKALEYYKKHVELFKEVEGKEKIKVIKTLESKYNLKIKDDELKIKNAKLNEYKRTEQYNQIRSKQKTLWIVLLSVIVVLILIISLLYIQRKNSNNERERLKIKNRLLNVQMNPHFIFNTLAVMQSYIEIGEAQKVSRYLDHFVRLTRLNLENSIENYIHIQNEIDTLTKYLSLQEMRFTDQFEYEIQTKNIDTKTDLFIPPMLIQPFVENAIQHGLRNINRKGKVSVSIEEKDEALHCTIEDNGLGLQPKKPFSNKKSISIKNVKERLDILSIELKREATLDIINKTEDRGRGVKVVLKIPFIRSLSEVKK